MMMINKKMNGNVMCDMVWQRPASVATRLLRRVLQRWLLPQLPLGRKALLRRATVEDQTHTFHAR